LELWIRQQFCLVLEIYWERTHAAVKFEVPTQQKQLLILRKPYLDQQQQIVPATRRIQSNGDNAKKIGLCKQR
jgi:hypothetical protein